MPTIYIDGQAIEVKQGENVLEACLNAGMDLPYFCWHPSMGSIGSCRQCALVQYQNDEDTQGRIIMGCMTPVSEGARFSLKAENATEFREAVKGEDARASSEEEVQAFELTARPHQGAWKGHLCGGAL